MDYSHYRYIKTERVGKVLVVTWNRPEALNAVNGDLHREMSTIFADIAGDQEAHAIMLTGTGRAFCAGGDIKWMEDLQGPGALDRTIKEGRKIIIDMLELEQPIIAAVNGPAIGLGATIALFSDVIFAAENAKIADPHVQVGVVAGDGGAVIWPWLVGVARAKEYLMTGDAVTAQEAERIGLINHVVPADQLHAKALEFATRLASGPSKAIRWTKVSVNKILRDTVNSVLDTSMALEGHTFHTADHQEAKKAFIEKRPPKFTGN